MGEEQRKEILKDVSSAELERFINPSNNSSNLIDVNEQIIKALDNLIQEKCSRITLKVWQITRVSSTYSNDEKNAKFQDVIDIVDEVDEISGDMRQKILNKSVGIDDVYQELYDYFKDHRIPKFHEEILAIIKERQERKGNMSLKERFSKTCSLV